MQSPQSDLQEKLQSAIQLGIDWLTRWQQPGGEFKGCENDLAAYYKALLLYAYCGRHDSGMKCLGYVKSNLTNKHGELCSGKSKTALRRMERNLANYMDGWVAIGAWLLGNYDYAERIVLRLEEQQNENHGGILTGPEKWSGKPRYDLSTAASCGRAFLLTGHRNSAVRAADFIAEALEHQTELSRGLDLCFNENWDHVKAPDISERTYYRLDLKKRGEKVWFPAFSSAFLCEIYQVRRKVTYLESAKKYYGVIASTPEFKEKKLANGKSGWVSGLLSQVTGEDCYSESLGWIVTNVLARQRNDGEFGPSPRSVTRVASAAEIPLPRRLERTAEFTTWSAHFLRMQSMGIFGEPGGLQDE